MLQRIRSKYGTTTNSPCVKESLGATITRRTKLPTSMLLPSRKKSYDAGILRMIQSLLALVAWTRLKFSKRSKDRIKYLLWFKAWQTDVFLLIVVGWFQISSSRPQRTACSSTVSTPNDYFTTWEMYIVCKRYIIISLANGLFHCLFLFPKDQLSTSFDEVYNHSSFFQVLHVVLSACLVETKSVLDEVVDAIYLLVLPHALLELFPCLAEGFLFIAFSFAFEIVVALQYFCVFFLHFEQEVADCVEKWNVFFHVCLTTYSFLFKNLEVSCQFFGIGDAFCSGLIDHQYLAYFSAIAFYFSEMSCDDIVMHVHVEVQLNCENQLVDHLLYLLPQLFLSKWVTPCLRFYWWNFRLIDRD